MARNPRPYQLKQFESVRDAFKVGKKHVIVSSPTGTGKTVSFVLMTKLAKDRGRKVLILMNRDVLVEQTLAELRENGVFGQREQGDERAYATAEVVVGSIQSMQGKHLERWPRDYFSLVLTDEVHGSASRTFKATLDRFESAHHVGFTATPERHDKRGLWKGYQDIVFDYSLRDAIKDGWLCDFEFVELDCPVTLDEKLAHHTTFKENEEVFDSKKYLPRLAECAIAESSGRKGLFFFPNCRVSAEFAQMLKALGLNAEHVDSSYMSGKRTTEVLEWFAKQKSAILCNSDLLSVGYNHPAIDTIGLFRPIASTPMYKQRLGRGTRPLASVDDYDTAEARREAIANSVKPNCRVLNVFWENGSHDLASPSCLITDDEDERIALDKARRPGSVTNLDNLEQKLVAKRMEDVEEEKRKFAEKVANSQAKKRRGQVWVGDILKRRNPLHKLASDKFVQFVRRMGADIPQDGTYSAYQIMRCKERIEKQRA
jgi:superfamily II DNA or RNA helicase